MIDNNDNPSILCEGNTFNHHLTRDDETRVVVGVVGHDADALVLLLLDVVPVLKQK